MAVVARWIALVWVMGLLLGALSTGSAGDADPLYRNCVKQCEKTGYVGESFFRDCQFLSDDVPDRPWFMQEPLYLRWKQWNCGSVCSYNCMMKREKEREELGLQPVKYHGKWPFKHVSVMEEPVSAALSAFNLIIHFNGWLSFFLLLQYKLPLRPQSRRTYYEYTGLCHIYAVLAMNAWFWSAIFHMQGTDLTERLDCSAYVALLGFFVLLSILRIFNVRSEATRVMVAAPLLAFTTTHILYLNIYEIDHGLNKIVCTAMTVGHLLLWAVWAGVTRHPSRFKLWFFVIGAFLATYLDMYDFAPYKGYIDSHAVWHAMTLPVSYLWWSFVMDDAAFQTSVLMKKVK